MTGPKANSEFCFPKTLYVPQGKAKGNVWGSRGNKTQCFPRGQSLIVLLYLLTQEQKEKKKMCLSKMICYGGCACSTSGSETKLWYRNDTITVFFFAANKKLRQKLSCFAFF